MKLPDELPLLGGKNNFAPLIEYVRPTSTSTLAERLAEAFANTPNEGPIVRIL